MKILIIEDEPAAVRRLEKLLGTIRPEFELVGALDSVESGLLWFSEQKQVPDLVFMDIHLADGSCFEIFESAEINYPVIFVTAYDEYAIEAFKVNAVDYLLKPVKEENLKNAIEKFEKFHPVKEIDYKKLAQAVGEATGTIPGKRFLIKFGKSIQLVDISEVAYFYTEDKITFLTTKAGKRYPIDYSLEKLEEIADPKKFFRINRQFIISIDAIGEMQPYTKSRVKVTLKPFADMGTIVSTERSSTFKKWLTGEE